MLRQRLISALVVIPLVIGAIWYGGIIFYAVVLLVSCLALREVYVLGGMSTRPLITLGIVANIFLLTIAYVTAVEQLFVG
ncbi:MAG: phosphatidate cytidylyltransferase, partial [Firmicutes bacterium]|nr:phosphatidate cytidylyltransferase [Bacillota bacterium]